MGILSEEHWHLDKRVPIALIFAIVVQTAGAFWWASDISGRVARLESDSQAATMIGERVARLEVIIERLEKVLDRMEDNRAKP